MEFTGIKEYVVVNLEIISVVNFHTQILTFME